MKPGKVWDHLKATALTALAGGGRAHLLGQPAFCFSAETVPAPLVHGGRRCSPRLPHPAHAPGRWNELWSWDGRFSWRVSFEPKDRSGMWLHFNILHYLAAGPHPVTSGHVVAMFVWWSTLSSELDLIFTFLFKIIWQKDIQVLAI